MRSGNLGVVALTVANMAIVRQVASELGLEPDFLIVGMQEPEGAGGGSGGGVPAFGVTTRSLLSPGGCWSVIGGLDRVLDIGAGDSFAEIYGPKRFAFLWLTKAFALARRVPLLLSPQTIGPFTRTPYRQLARMVLTRARAVIARDQASLDALKTIAPGARGLLAVDVAFALPYEDRRDERGGERVRVGVNVSGLLFHEAESGRNRFGLDANYADLMVRFVAELSARPEIELHLLTHVASKGAGRDDDGWITDRLAQAYPAAIRVPDFAGPSEAKSYISSLDFLVAGRMHACIAAFSAGVPVAPVAYSRKFSGLFNMLGYRWMVPVKGMGADEALGYLNGCLDRREELSAAARAGMAKVEALLDVYRAELRSFLSPSAAGR
jgi:polysaccharide pyruvyl transferase WcaK-like protein